LTVENPAKYDDYSITRKRLRTGHSRKAGAPLGVTMNQGTINDSGLQLFRPFYWFFLALLFVCGDLACANPAINDACIAMPDIELQSKGVPFDWSYKHLIASGDVTNGPLGRREHRLLYNYLKRKQSECGGPGQISPGTQAHDQIDWDVPLGAPMADGTYPAKYNFDLPGQTPTCADFIVYGLNTAGVTGGQPNLVGLTNLYSGTAGGNGLCNGNAGVYRQIYGATGYAATVKFAYNGSTLSGGAITNSVVMSEDGLKIAYVESTGTASALHVVTLPSGNGSGTIQSWAPGGGPVPPKAAAPPSISTVPNSGTWKGDSYSSVWVDYSNDLAYVGTDDGSLHKVQNIFCTSQACKNNPVLPTEISDGTWPVAIPGATTLTSPVEDTNGVIYVAGVNSGMLYAVTSAGLVITSSQSFMPNSIVDGGMLDLDGNGTTQAIYWFSNSQSAVTNPTVRQPQMVQTNSGLTRITNYPLLLNGTSAWGGATTTVHAGTFDNAFYNTRNGNIWACGWQSVPNQGYPLGVLRFGINGTTVTPDTSKVYSQLSPQNVPPNVNYCAPLTEVLDSAGTDHIFVSSKTGYAMAAGTCVNQASCIAGFTIGSTGSPATYSLTTTGSFALNTVGQSANFTNYTSGIVVDNAVPPTSNSCGPNGNQSCAQAASIYFTYGNDAIKLTQAQLQ
jgi:hypothetical protein